MNKIIPMLLIFCTLLFLISCTAYQPDNGNTGMMELVLDGTVINLGENTVELRDASGKSFAFSTDNAVISPRGRRPIIGDNATIYYYGSSADTKDATVSRIDLTHIDRAGEKVREILDKMTLEEKCGHIFFVRRPDRDAALDAGIYHLGGYILYARDFTKERR